MFVIKKSSELTSEEIKIVLNNSSITEWKSLSDREFYEKFIDSEYFFLIKEDQIVAMGRINYDFTFKVKDTLYTVPELVGLVAFEKNKGYGREILHYLKEYLQEKNSDCIGFCYEHNRGFYNKCKFELLEGYAKFFKEMDDDGNWVSADDDDVILINVSPKIERLLHDISEFNAAYFFPKTSKL